MNQKSNIAHLTEEIKVAIKDLVMTVVQEDVWVTYYGANDVHPKHLVYWICVQSDAEKRRLQNDQALYTNLRQLLTTHNYPSSGREGVRIGFESQETVDRVSNGNWWHHWK